MRLDPSSIGAGLETRRFLVFAFEDYSQAGGLGDVVLSTDEELEARRLVGELQKKSSIQIDMERRGGRLERRGEFHVFDCDRQRVVIAGAFWSYLNEALKRFEGTAP